MLNSKQRAFLKAKANLLNPILFMGKGGLNDAMIDQADGALKTRELIKGKALEASPMTAAEAAAAIADATGADVVRVIGRCFVLFRPNPENPVISSELPKDKKAKN